MKLVAIPGGGGAGGACRCPESRDRTGTSSWPMWETVSYSSSIPRGAQSSRGTRPLSRSLVCAIGDDVLAVGITAGDEK